MGVLFCAIAHSQRHLAYTSAVPAKPKWYRRLDAIRAALEEPLPCPWVDRAMIEELFGVGARSAQHILRSMGGRLIGGALAVERSQAVRWLAARALEPGVQSELRRVARLESALDQARRQWRARRIVIGPAAGAAAAGFDALPPDIELGPGRLCIRFDDAAGLLERLAYLSRAMVNDFDRFEQLAGQTAKQLDI